MNKDFIKFVAILLVSSTVGGFVGGLVGGNRSDQNVRGGGTRFPNGISADSTSPSAGQVRGTTLTVTGTSTVATSPDGFIVYGSFTVATGTAKSVYTNTSSPLMCSDESGAVLKRASSFFPSLQVAIGTSTSASGYVTNLLASTTFATSTGAETQVMDVTYAAPFFLNTNESIVAALSDNAWATASSTYYGNATIEMAFHCWTVGQ